LPPALSLIGAVFAGQVIANSGVIFHTIIGFYVSPPEGFDFGRLAEALGASSAEEWGTHPALAGQNGNPLRAAALRKVILEVMAMLETTTRRPKQHDPQRGEIEMRKLLILAAAAAISTPALAEPPSYRIEKQEVTRRAAMKWEMIFLALSAADAAVTIDCLHRDVCEEVNPLFGKHPSTRTIVLGKIVGGAIHFAAFTYLNDRNPRVALRAAQVSVVAQGSVVAFNLRVAF
jgi:hypothetical protein